MLLNSSCKADNKIETKTHNLGESYKKNQLTKYIFDLKVRAMYQKLVNVA